MTMLSSFLRRFRALAAQTAPRLALFAMLALALCWPLTRKAALLNEFRDAHVLWNYEYVAAASVTEFAELPLWNPYYCGGMYGLGTPQSRFAAPTFLVSLLFGASRAIPVTVFLMLLLGMEGFFRYARTRTGSALGPLLAAPIFAFNGFLGAAYFLGWINFFGFLLLPWTLFGVGQALRGRISGVLIVGLAFAFNIGFGGTYSAPLAAILAVVESVRVLIELRPSRAQLPRRLSFLAWAGLAALVLSAFRLWPIAETLSAAPRIMAGSPGHSLKAIADMLFVKSAPQGGNININGLFFMGPAPLMVALLGLFTRRGLGVLLLLGLSLWTATGYAYGASPFVWMRELPLLSTLRYPERFLFVSALFGAELAALGIDLLVRLARRRDWIALGVLAAAGVAGFGVISQIKNIHRVAEGMWLAPSPPSVERPFHQARGNRWALAYYAPMARGSLSCWEAYPVPMSPLLRGDLQAEEYLAEGTQGSVERLSWSPNQIALKAELQNAGRLLVNQNWHPGWRASIGTVTSQEGLLAVDLPAGAHKLILRFAPRSAYGGGLISLAGLGAVAAMVWLERKRRLATVRGLVQASALLLGLPFFAGLGSMLVIAEARPPAPLVRNANGVPAFLADGLPEGVIPLDIQFDVPVKLVGVRFPASADELGVGNIELYWRVDGDVPRSVGVFVSLRDSKGRVIQADHEVLAASVFLSGAPRGQVIRDAFSVKLGQHLSGSWRMSVGLWHVSGDRSRVPIREAGALELREHSVMVGTFELR